MRQCITQVVAGQVNTLELVKAGVGKRSNFIYIPALLRRYQCGEGDQTLQSDRKLNKESGWLTPPIHPQQAQGGGGGQDTSVQTAAEGTQVPGEAARVRMPVWERQVPGTGSC